MARAFDRAGLELGAHETPREGLQRARAAEVDVEQLEALTAAVQVHERDRYAGAGAPQGSS
jgi:hypothetical protein